MNSVVDTIIAAPASSEAQLPSRVLEIRPEESKLVCVGADGREFALSRLVGSNVQIGDEVLVPASTGTATADTEVYIRNGRNSGSSSTRLFSPWPPGQSVQGRVQATTPYI